MRYKSQAGYKQSLRRQARTEYGCDDIEIDPNAIVSETDTGAWVAAWVYVRRDGDTYEPAKEGKAHA